MRVYYNEFDPYAAQWLRNLISGGLLPPGDVDERDVRDVTAGDLSGYDQVHLFAGIGGWPLAFRMAGWPDDRPVWTGSCPCQPFSVAGARKGTNDERHLWPEFRRLVEECEPPVLFGEQVASKDGRAWLSGVRTDLEALGYAVGGADLCAAGSGAPHIRQRLWWVADSASQRRHRGESTAEEAGRAGIEDCSSSSGMEYTQGDGWQQWRTQSGGRSTTSGCCDGGNVWVSCDLLLCVDGKARRTEPGTFPLAHGISSRVGKLRAYGNAIVPQVAAEFVTSYLEARSFPVVRRRVRA